MLSQQQSLQRKWLSDWRCYNVGSIGVASVGRDVRFTITGIGVTSQLILDNVQGDFIVGAGSTLKFYNSAGVSTELNGQTAGADVTIPSDGLTEVSDGLHTSRLIIENHGMNFGDNIIDSGVRPDIKPTKLAVAYDKASSDPISVIDAGSFDTFEGVGIGTTNTGLFDREELIEYTSTTGTTISGITRGVLTKSYQRELQFISMNLVA